MQFGAVLASIVGNEHSRSPGMLHVQPGNVKPSGLLHRIEDAAGRMGQYNADRGIGTLGVVSPTWPSGLSPYRQTVRRHWIPSLPDDAAATAALSEMTRGASCEGALHRHRTAERELLAG